MDLKIYKSATGVQYSFLVNKKEPAGSVCVSFHGTAKTFQTRDVELQQSIEDTRYFKSGKIVLSRVVAGEKAEGQKSSPVDYPDVTDINKVVEVLVADFGLKEGSLKTPAQIKKAMAEVGASFPNYIF